MVQTLIRFKRIDTKTTKSPINAVLDKNVVYLQQLIYQTLQIKTGIVVVILQRLENICGDIDTPAKHQQCLTRSDLVRVALMQRATLFSSQFYIQRGVLDV